MIVNIDKAILFGIRSLNNDLVRLEDEKHHDERIGEEFTVHEVGVTAKASIYWIEWKDVA